MMWGADAGAPIAALAALVAFSAAAWAMPWHAADSPAMLKLVEDVSGMRGDLRAMGARLDGIDVSGMRGDLRDMGARLDGIDTRLDALGALVNDLAESVVTPAVGARLEACGRTSVVSAFIFLSGKRDKTFLTQCSAVPLPESSPAALGSPPRARTSTFFLTSAHCFFRNSTGPVAGDVGPVGNETTLAFLGETYNCFLLASFLEHPSPIDLAVLRCPTAVPIAPTRLSTATYAAQIPVALLGFTQGRHLDLTMTSRLAEKGVTKEYALHTRVTRLSNSFQLPDAGDAASSVSRAAAPAPPSRGYVDDGLPPLVYVRASSSSAQSSGFVDLSPWGGMSGGAVVDTSCGLLGVIEQRSRLAPGGEFLRLVPDVVAMILRATSGVGGGVGSGCGAGGCGAGAGGWGGGSDPQASCPVRSAVV